MVQKVYQLPGSGYEYTDLEPANSADLLEVHYSKHHQAYVNGANQNLHIRLLPVKRQTFVS